VGAYSLGGSYSDSSNASFSLALPTLTVTAPNGGESLTVGVSTTISWTVNTGSFSGFNIERSENAGSSWTTIASGLGSGVTSQSWTPTVATTQGLIRVTGTGTYGNSDTSNANFTVVDLPWVNISTTLLFFVADDATGTTNVTSQTDRKGNGTLTDGLTPYLTRQGGGRRYGSATALATGALIRTSAGPSGTGGSGVLHGMLLSGLLASLGWFADVGSGFHEGTRCYVTATHILLQGRNSGSGTTTRSCAHGGISNGVRHSFGWSYLSGETTTFYLDGVAIGTGSSPGNSFGAGGKWHIGALEYTFGTAQNQNAQGAFIAGMVASGIMTAQQHADVHAYMNALPA
jgi:hypothetical protein